VDETLVNTGDLQLSAAPEDNDEGIALAREQILNVDPMEWTASYEKQDDTVYIRKRNRDGLAISYFMPQEPLILVNLDAVTGELVGIDFQHFKRLFLKKHPEGRGIFFPHRPWFRGRRRNDASETTQQVAWSVRSAVPGVGLA